MQMMVFSTRKGSVPPEWRVALGAHSLLSVPIHHFLGIILDSAFLKTRPSERRKFYKSCQQLATHEVFTLSSSLRFTAPFLELPLNMMVSFLAHRDLGRSVDWM